MDKSNITQIVTYSKNYKEVLGSHKDFTYYHLNKFEREEDIHTILNDIHRTLPDWTTAPTLQTIKDRLDAGTEGILQYYKGNITGWWWNALFFTHDFVNKVSDLPTEGVYCGNTYIIKDIAPYSSGVRLYGYCIGKALEGIEAAYGYMDNWNTPSIKLCVVQGGIEEEWIQ